MPVTINGNGSITGLAQGGIDGTKVLSTAAQPAGSVIQAVSATTTTTTSNTTTTFADTGLTASSCNLALITAFDANVSASTVPFGNPPTETPAILPFPLIVTGIRFFTP